MLALPQHDIGGSGNELDHRSNSSFSEGRRGHFICAEVRRQGASLDVRLLGSMAVRRENIEMVLPASRKVRGLLAYLLLSPRPVTRSHLCELLWDVPNDPRGELRWCLSKIRGLIDRPAGRHRIESQADTVKLDLSDCFVDAIEIAGAIGNAETSADLQRMRTLSALLAGDFLDGLEIERCPVFMYLARGSAATFPAVFHATLLERLVRTVPDDEVTSSTRGNGKKLAPLMKVSTRSCSMCLPATAGCERATNISPRPSACSNSTVLTVYHYETPGVQPARIETVRPALLPH